MLPDSYLSCLSVCLSVTLVYCGQTVEWIKMKHGMQVGLGPGHIVLDGDRGPPAGGEQQPLFFGPRLLWPWSPISATAELLFAQLTLLPNHQNAFQ